MMLIILILLVQNIFQKKTKAFIDRYLSISTIIFTMQAYDSIMSRYFCIGFIDFMLAGKTLTEFTKLFSTNNL